MLNITPPVKIGLLPDQEFIINRAWFGVSDCRYRDRLVKSNHLVIDTDSTLAIHTVSHAIQSVGGRAFEIGAQFFEQGFVGGVELLKLYS